MTFPARREPWLVPVLALDGAVSIGIVIWLAMEASASRQPALYVIAASVLLSLAFAFWLLLGIRYEVTDDGVLVTHAGPFRTRISVRDIDEVFPTKRNPLSPAWAQDRLQMLHRTEDRIQSAILNPEDRRAFLDRLAASDTELVREGERLQRRRR